MSTRGQGAPLYVSRAGGAAGAAGAPLWFQCDATDAIFEPIDFGAGALPCPLADVRGTHAVLRYLVDIDSGLPWQRSVGNAYAGANIAVGIYWIGAPESAGDVVWAVAFERDNAGEDASTENWGSFESAVSPAVGGDSDIQFVSIPLTQAQADGIAAGEPLRIYVKREGSSSGDTYTGSVYLLRVIVSEAP